MKKKRVKLSAGFLLKINLSVSPYILLRNGCWPDLVAYHACEWTSAGTPRNCSHPPFRFPPMQRSCSSNMPSFIREKNVFFPLLCLIAILKCVESVSMIEWYLIIYVYDIHVHMYKTNTWVYIICHHTRNYCVKIAWPL